MSDTVTRSDPDLQRHGARSVSPAMSPAGSDGTIFARGPDWSPWSAAAAGGALALLLFMVTKGPVFRLRIEAAALSGDFIDDRWVQGAFVAGGLLVVVVCLPATRVLTRDRLMIATTAVVLVAVLASAAWSVNAGRTVDQAVMMAVGTIAALLAGASLSRLAIVVALAAATHAGVALSLFAWWRDWPLVLDRNGDLAGIYFNRNSLGPVAVAALASATAVAVWALRRRRWLVATPLLAVAAVDLWVWEASGSLTPMFGVVVAAVAVGIFALTLPGPRAVIRRRVAWVAGGVIGVGVIIAVAARGSIATRLDRSPTFSGRTEIWDVVLQFVGERPLQGWGFMAAWTRPEIVAALDEQYGREVYEAHSGFVEVLLGVGVVGFVALVALVVVVLGRVGTAAWRTPDELGLFLFGVAVYAVAVNLGETMVGANLLPWTLLVLVAGRAVADRPGIGLVEVTDRSHP